MSLIQSRGRSASSLGTTGTTIGFSEEEEDPSWDGFVATVAGSSHVQTSLWGQVKASEGWRPVRMVVSRGGEMVGGAQVFIRQLPLGNAVAYVPKGPVYHLSDNNTEALLVEGLAEIASRYRIRHLSVQPPNDGWRMVPLLQRAGYRVSDTSVAPVATVQIDLNQEPEEILARMRKNHRRYVRHGLRSGVTGRTGTEADLEQFYQLVLATARRQHFDPPPFRHFHQLWRTFHSRGLLQLFIVDYQGAAVSGQLAVAFGDRVIAKNSGWTGEHGSLGVNHVMEWTTIRWAQENGFRYYDLEGIDPAVAELVVEGNPLSESMLKSHSFYKLGFGGEIGRFPRSHVLVPNPLLRWGYWTVYPRVEGMRSVRAAVNRLRTRSEGSR